MDAYPHGKVHRILAAETREYLAERTGGAPVLGFAEMMDPGEATVGGARIAGFMETHDRREWYLPLSAQTGMSWQTEPVPLTNLEKICFLLSVGFGNGSPLPQPSGHWDIYVNDHFAVSVRVVKHSQLWRRQECTFAFSANRIEAAEPFGSLCLSSVLKAESFASFGPGLLSVPASWVQPGVPATIRVEARSQVSSARWFQLAVAPKILERSDLYRAVHLLTSERVPQAGGLNVYFGDIHTHSGQVGSEANNEGCGLGSRAENYEYARGPGALDFYALTDHEWQIDPAGIEEYLGLADEYSEDNLFVCLPGYEFSNLLYGHRNVYFRGPGGTVINANREWGLPTKDPEISVPPPELWHGLEENGVPFITVPHHSSAASHPCSWDFYHPQYDRLIEVYSTWGSSEYYGDFPRGVADRFRTLDVRDALRRGCRAGLIASSDGHDGHPGNAQSPLFKHHHIFHHLGSGLAAVLARELSREEVFDALYARCCYATTGVPIVLAVGLNGHPMGAELPAVPEGQRPRLRISCQGTNGLDHIRIVKNSQVIATIPCHGEFEWETEWEDRDYTPTHPSYYYVRVVQVDWESAWSSPIWVG